MRLYIDIDEYEYNITSEVKDAVVERLADYIFAQENNPDTLRSQARVQINKIISDHQDEIIQKVVDKVAELVAKKKAIVELTPKASALVAADKENIAYFEQMVDKAIARRFKA